MSLPRIAISTGDPAGIGPEVTLKAALDPRVNKICRPLLVGDRGALEAHAAACGLAPNLRSVARAADATWNDGALPLVERRQFKPSELHIGAIAAPHGEAALDSAKTAIDAALAGEVDAVVAAHRRGGAQPARGRGGSLRRRGAADHRPGDRRREEERRSRGGAVWGRYDVPEERLRRLRRHGPRPGAHHGQNPRLCRYRGPHHRHAGAILLGRTRQRARHRREEPRRSGRDHLGDQAARDRKSTRLNSSHGYISYAVF